MVKTIGNDPDDVSTTEQGNASSGSAPYLVELPSILVAAIVSVAIGAMSGRPEVVTCPRADVKELATLSTRDKLH
jgi:hypothetical protein